jgi:hypothetical protein
LTFWSARSTTRLARSGLRGAAISSSVAATA